MDQVSRVTARWQLIASIAFAVTLVILLGTAVVELRRANDQMESIYFRLYSVTEEAEKTRREIWYLRQDVNEQGSQIRRKLP